MRGAVYILEYTCMMKGNIGQSERLLWKLQMGYD